jgi:hypothetical protein
VLTHESRQLPSWLIFNVRQNMHAAKAKKTATVILECFATEDFDRLLRIASASRVSAPEVRKVVVDYGRRLTMPTTPIDEVMDIVEVSGSHPKSWSVNLPLWTKEEGRSDLTLEMRFIESEDEIYSIEIEDLHVL